MDGVSSNDVKHSSSYVPSSDIGKVFLLQSPWFCITFANVLCKRDLWMCYVLHTVECLMHLDPWNVLCAKF